MTAGENNTWSWGTVIGMMPSVDKSKEQNQFIHDRDAAVENLADQIFSGIKPSLDSVVRTRLISELTGYTALVAEDILTGALTPDPKKKETILNGGAKSARFFSSVLVPDMKLAGMDEDIAKIFAYWIMDLVKSPKARSK